MNKLDGGGNGVTIIVTGEAGTTVAPSAASLGSLATSVCSSLSSVACFGLGRSECAQVSTATKPFHWATSGSAPAVVLAGLVLVLSVS